MFDSFSFGCITWNHEPHKYDVVVIDSQLRERGPRDNNHLLAAPELQNYLKQNTKKVVIGTGESGVLEVSGDARALMESKGIEWVAAPSAEAIGLYNSEPDKSIVVAVIHSTC
ncbi:MTH938/NDUFAF3 family protein [archaeon]